MFAAEAHERLMEQNARLRYCFVQAVELTRVWHTMPIRNEGDRAITWALYYHHAPEMQPIRDMVEELELDIIPSLLPSDR